MATLTLKRDPYLLGLAALVVVVAAALVAHGDVTWKEAAATVLAAFLVPGILGQKKDDAPEPKLPNIGGDS